MIRMLHSKGKLYKIEFQKEEVYMRHSAIADLLREAVMFQIRVEERAITHRLCELIGAKIARFFWMIIFLTVDTAAPADLRARL